MKNKSFYEQAYANLIALRKTQPLEKNKSHPGLIETHHIVPSSCGGEDDESNLINLYAKEHFMAHMYLWKIHHDDEFHDQMTCAFVNMIKGTKAGYRSSLREFILASEEYQAARIEFSQFCSKTISSKISGENNGAFGKHWYKDPNSKSCAQYFEGQQPDGWIRGKYQTPPEIGSNNSKWLIRKVDLSEQGYFPIETAKQMISSGEWEHKALPMSDRGKANIKMSREKRSAIERRSPRHIAYLKETQEMADYYTLYGFEATCKKFPGRSGTCSVEAMLMRFIKARNKYGIHFESVNNRGKKRAFKTPSAKKPDNPQSCD